MADELLYHFSDEDDDEDGLLDRAFDRWEQMGGGSTRGPLFQFTMQPIGRRRRWREVVERVQFNAQLRQLRDPVAEDNIGDGFNRSITPGYRDGARSRAATPLSFCQFCHHCPRVHRRLPNGQFYCGGVFATHRSLE